ncbi:uncharacterized protein LOC113381870 [Ctenocephalides felis]|uniref:uncharacterized protein LOC113381870 n=1 Tax=Ctenocephalides felis TaxID=7515 RepID=UPI000E6E55EF|nr:uncharacterized protein LOC113381870 [Ctenocephalides felis]
MPNHQDCVEVIDNLNQILYPLSHKIIGKKSVTVTKLPSTGYLSNFTEPTTEIAGEPDVFINRGSIINLLCEIRYAPQPPPHVTWSHEGTVINYDSPRGGISSVTEKGIFTTSRLLIQQAIGSDSGVYSCTPSNAPNATIRVHVVDAGLPAAVQSLAVQKLQSYTILSICCILSIIKLMLKK